MTIKKTIYFVTLFYSFFIQAQSEERTLLEDWKSWPKEKKVLFHRALLQMAAVQSLNAPTSVPQERKNPNTDTPWSIEELTGIKEVSRENFRAVVRTLLRANAALNKQWDNSLAEEAGRVINLAMNVDSNFYYNADPFYEILKGPKKDDFIKIVLEKLDSPEKKDRFKRNVYYTIRPGGNG